MTDLTGKSIIVTGGASGMGAEGSLHAARYGASVTVADLDETKGAEVVARIVAAGGVAQFVRTDIADEASVAALVDAAVTRYGTLDGAYNNAGLPPYSSARTGFFLTADLEADKFMRAIQVNVLGTFLCMKYEIAAMLKTGGGAIVNTASANALVAIPGCIDYIASKHAVVGLTKGAAIDYATQGIRINSILPGIIRTPMLDANTGGDPKRADAFSAAMPIGRLGEPAEVAKVALYLLSDDASLVTGASVSVDGAQSTV
ncbi:SDR family NAD(P)-dependent oxidoreductase [Agreia sp.]|uniref:SDR family NAD(P)-dependent oxidoreductase n=1 Tax=Agreia sp. TaxID=1872416 RepID=UPI0035BBA4D1